jgi:hypothetical protein
VASRLRTLAFGLALIVVACGPIIPGGQQSSAPLEPQQAAQGLSAYLAAVAGGASDRGWSLLHAELQRRYPGGEAVQAASSADWTKFQWTMVDLRRDDQIYCGHLDVPNGLASVPAFLRDPASGVVQFVAKPDRLPAGHEAIVCISLAADPEARASSADRRPNQPDKRKPARRPVLCVKVGRGGRI